MTREEFLKLLNAPWSHIHVIDTTTVATGAATGLLDSLKVESLIKAHEETKLISEYLPFNCNWDKNGICERWREFWRKNNKKNSSCCCSNCSYTIGYLRIIPKESINKYARKFSKKFGFWRKNRGCILPRRMRSRICIAYACSATRETRLVFKAYRNILNSQENKLVDLCKLKKEKKS
jgi:hypothetical protein